MCLKRKGFQDHFVYKAGDYFDTGDIFPSRTDWKKNNGRRRRSRKKISAIVSTDFDFALLWRDRTEKNKNETMGHDFEQHVITSVLSLSDRQLGFEELRASTKVTTATILRHEHNSEVKLKICFQRASFTMAKIRNSNSNEDGVYLHQESKKKRNHYGHSQLLSVKMGKKIIEAAQFPQGNVSIKLDETSKSSKLCQKHLRHLILRKILRKEKNME